MRYPHYVQQDLRVHDILEYSDGKSMKTIKLNAEEMTHKAPGRGKSKDEMVCEDIPALEFQDLKSRTALHIACKPFKIYALQFIL